MIEERPEDAAREKRTVLRMIIMQEEGDDHGADVETVLDRAEHHDPFDSRKDAAYTLRRLLQAGYFYPVATAEVRVV